MQFIDSAVLSATQTTARHCEREGGKTKEAWESIVEMVAYLELIGKERAYLVWKSIRLRRCGERGDRNRGLVFFALSDF